MFCTYTISRTHATAYAWMETCTFQIFWSDRVLTVLFLAINRLHNHFPLQTCCFAHWKCFFFTMPYLCLIILIIVDCRCQYSSFFSFSFLVLLKVFVNGGNDSRTHCSHNIFTMTACAMVTKSTEGKLRIQLWHVFLFSPWVRRTTLESVYITTVFFFFLKRYFLGFLLCIKTITPDQRHFVLETFLLVSIFLCLI